MKFSIELEIGIIYYLLLLIWLSVTHPRMKAGVAYCFLTHEKVLQLDKQFAIFVQLASKNMIPAWHRRNLTILSSNINL